MLNFIRKAVIRAKIAIKNELFYMDAAAPLRELLDKVNKKIRHLEFIQNHMPDLFTDTCRIDLAKALVSRADIQNKINRYSKDPRLASENVVLFPSH